MLSAPNERITMITPRLATTLAGILLLAPVALGAAEIEPRAREVVQALSDHYSRLDGFRGKAVSTLQMTAEGMKQEMTTEYDVVLQRPNKLALVGTRGRMISTLVSDGSAMNLLVPALNQYMTNTAPKEVAELTEDNPMGAALGNLMLQVLLARKPADALLENVKSLNHGGDADLDGVPCHILEGVEQEVKWRMWVQRGETAWLWQVVIDMGKTMSPTPQGGFKELQMEMILRYANLEANPKLDAATFQFKAPEGAKLVKSFFEREDSSSALLGKAAPDFTLDLLDGGKVQLSQHKGKEIVILDFWATWCGPCRKAMPVLAEVATTYKDKGVRLYAVDLAEPPSKVRAFLDQNKLTQLSVALDKESKVGEDYGVNGIPHTVLIGKDGTVQAVHVGLLPNLKAKLSGELDALLDGKQLVSEKK